MAEETPDENDVEAEMLRMMQEEIEGGEGEAGEEGDALAAEVETGQGEEGGDGASIDEMLEQEMLRAMEGETDDGGGAIAPYAGQLPAAAAEAPEGIERLSDIDVTITVELGGNLIPIKEILTWSRDSIVQLEPEEHEPVDVLVNGRLFARGEIVVVGDTFGVRIIELVDQPEDAS